MPRICSSFQNRFVANEFKIRGYAARTEIMRNYQNLLRKCEEILKDVSADMFLIQNIFLKKRF
jgi:hypothetical protein